MLKVFEKYHGLGNDFMLVEFDPLASEMPWEGVAWRDALVASVCDRHRGVGADGVIFCGVEGDASVRMVIFNQDGSRPEMCGNGVRCVAAWALRRGLVEREEGVYDVSYSLNVSSDAGPRACKIMQGEEGLQVAVGMGVARASEREEVIVLCGRSLAIWRVDMGNPHAVVFIERGGQMPSLDEIDRLGQAANSSPELFERGVNLEIVCEVERGGERVFDVIVYERGVGRTQACGTGACAVAVAAWRAGRAAPGLRTVVNLPGGALTMREDGGGEVWMTGPAEHVFDGVVSDAVWRRVEATGNDGSQRFEDQGRS